MKRENVFLNLDLSDLSAQLGALHVDNKIILIDNLDDVADLPRKRIPFSKRQKSGNIVQSPAGIKRL